MDEYERQAYEELVSWKEEMARPPSTVKQMTSNFQERVNRVIPENIHKMVTAAIREMTRTVIVGSQFTNIKPDPGKLKTLRQLEEKARSKVVFYRSSAAAEGAVTGFGGIFMGMIDLPLWLSLKMKMLFEIASLYGHNTREVKERLYILHIFQLTFSSQKHRNILFPHMNNWEEEMAQFEGDLRDFDWKTFQLQYRDQIDLRKLLQLIPGAGAIVGAYVNHTMTNQLGKMAMNSYRMRVFR